MKFIPRWLHFVWGMFLLTSLPEVSRAQKGARPTVPSHRLTRAYSDRVVVILPPAYVDEMWPSPPVNGFFAWKMSLGGDAAMTVVLRTDSAITATTNRKVLQATNLYLCPADATSVLACNRKARGSVRLQSEALQVEITEPSIVSQANSKRPAAVLRQVFEPDGRFKVDFVTILYR